MGAAQYALMSAAPYFITTARGDIHDEAAPPPRLCGTISSAGAGRDVLHRAASVGSPTRTGISTNVLVSPHSTACHHIQGNTSHIGPIAAARSSDALGRPTPLPLIVNPTLAGLRDAVSNRCSWIRPQGEHTRRVVIECGSPRPTQWRSRRIPRPFKRADARRVVTVVVTDSSFPW